MKEKIHWESIYSTKQPDEVSWTQEIPATSLAFFRNVGLHRDASIIDVGGGDSKFVDFLLAEGYTNITVLDISETALIRAQKRLGENASKVKWIVSDINDFTATDAYDYWHDRATFHFLLTEKQISHYIALAKNAVKANGVIMIATFSMEGPIKCSGIPVKQYAEESLTTLLERGFKKITCTREDHLTPFNRLQNFLYCSFRRSG